MPAVSKDQRRAAGIALAVHDGKMPMSALRGASKQMYESMTIKELREFAGTKEKKLPKKKK